MIMKTIYDYLNESLEGVENVSKNGRQCLLAINELLRIKNDLGFLGLDDNDKEEMLLPVMDKFDELINDVGKLVTPFYVNDIKEKIDEADKQ